MRVGNSSSFDELGFPDPSQLGDSVVNGAFVQFAGRLVQAIIQGATLITLSRLLGPDEVGVAALAMTVVALPGIFREFGLGLPTMRRDKISSDLVNSLFWMSFGIGTALGLLVALLSPIISELYDDTRVGKAMLVLALEFAVSGLVIQHSALLRRSFRNKTLVLVDLSAETVALLVGVLMAISDASYTAIVTRILAFQIVRVVLLFRVVRWRPSRPGWTTESGSAAREGAAVGLFDVANYFSRNADDLLIGWRWGTLSLGLYRRAYDILLLPLRLVTIPVGQVAVPYFSRTINHPERYCRGIRILLDQLVLVTLPAAVLFVMFPDLLISTLLGTEWLEAAPMLRWMGVLAVLQPIVGSAGWLFLAEGRSAEFAKVGAVVAALNVTAFLVALPHGPTTVAAVSTIMSLTLTMPLVVILVTRKGPASLLLFGAPLARAGIAGGAAGLALLLLRQAFPEDGAGALVVAVASTVLVVSSLQFLLPGGRSRFDTTYSLARRQFPSLLRSNRT